MCLILYILRTLSKMLISRLRVIIQNLWRMSTYWYTWTKSIQLTRVSASLSLSTYQKSWRPSLSKVLVLETWNSLPLIVASSFYSVYVWVCVCVGWGGADPTQLSLLQWTIGTRLLFVTKFLPLLSSLPISYSVVLSFCIFSPKPK